MMVQKTNINQAVSLLKKSKFTTAYTGAGISVESGIPAFRGTNGLWSKYDTNLLEYQYFLENPKKSWEVIREIFYDHFGKAKPNKAHLILARMEQRGFISSTITQNIDNLHQAAGSKKVAEFHGNSQILICLSCYKEYHASDISLEHLPPTCRQCGGLLKPNFVFFGEAIPKPPLVAAYEAANKSDIFLIIGTTGEVMPANQFPYLAKENGAKIIEINPEPSLYTHAITDIFLQGKAGKIMESLEKILFSAPLDND